MQLLLSLVCFHTADSNGHMVLDLIMCCLTGSAAWWAYKCLGSNINGKHRGCPSEPKEETGNDYYNGLSQHQTNPEDCWYCVSPCERWNCWSVKTW